MDYLNRLIIAFELHSVSEMKECFANGIDPNMTLEGQPLIHQLINMYSRGPNFKECIRTFTEYGLEMEDKVLLAVLLDDESTLDTLLAVDASLMKQRYTFNCTFTPLYDVTLLHICAEYNHLSCARILVKYGANIDARAGMDENGFGGHTPVFHTVNQDANKSLDMLEYLIESHVDLSHTVTGLIWGKGYEWETFIPSVNPISYAMMGLLRQFQRTESDIYHVVSCMMRARYNCAYQPGNIQNKYLQG
ncbi:MAG: ankyrin repeat domain-containing protein [Saprospiraceae bacterium]|nr:ankyrin repeat domain-containing protein [Saprospiraceae bacterium]